MIPLFIMAITTSPESPHGVDVLRAAPPQYADIVSSESLAFLAALEREFRTWREALLERRSALQLEIDGGLLPDFPFSTTGIRKATWQVAPIPDDLLDRRVEIITPPHRSALVDALDSGANVCIADFEDFLSPTWENLVTGQSNVRNAIRGTLQAGPTKDQHESAKPALMIRPRGLHLSEPRVLVDGKPMAASVFDFGLFFFHNARALVNEGTAPYVYIPKLEHPHEARFWNSLFCKAQDLFGIPRGTIRAAVFIETLPAIFQADEILFELQDHSAGLSCGKSDYIFSCIKTLRKHQRPFLPNREMFTVHSRFLRAYSHLLVQVCHRRGIHAIGGFSAYDPIHREFTGTQPALSRRHVDKQHEERIILKRIRLEKEQEALDGHDGAIVSHPELVPHVRKVFDARMNRAHQIHVSRNDVHIGAKDLYDTPRGEITQRDISGNINIALQYLASWFSGTGSISTNNEVVNTAVTEICRTQLWQWLHHPSVRVSGGFAFTEEVYRSLSSGELAKLQNVLGDRFDRKRFTQAAELLDSLVLQDTLADGFFTSRAMSYIN